MTNEEILAEIKKVEKSWSEGSDLDGVGVLMVMNLLLLVEVRCLLKGLAEKQRLGNWPGTAFEIVKGSKEKRGY